MFGGEHHALVSIHSDIWHARDNRHCSGQRIPSKASKKTTTTTTTVVSSCLFVLSQESCAMTFLLRNWWDFFLLKGKATLGRVLSSRNITDQSSHQRVGLRYLSSTSIQLSIVQEWYIQWSAWSRTEFVVLLALAPFTHWMSRTRWHSGYVTDHCRRGLLVDWRTGKSCSIVMERSVEQCQRQFAHCSES